MASPSKSPSPNPPLRASLDGFDAVELSGTTAATEARKSGDGAPPPSQSEEPTPRCPSDPKISYGSHRDKTRLVWVYQPKG